MWQRFTERTRRIIFFAQEEAARRDSSVVRPEHLLHAMIREEDCVAARILTDLGVRLSALRDDLKDIPSEKRGKRDEMQLNEAAKQLIDLAYEEARRLNGKYIGTEHFLLGACRLEPTQTLLLRHGVRLDNTRDALVKLQGFDSESNTVDRADSESETPGRYDPRSYSLLSWLSLWFKRKEQDDS